MINWKHRYKLAYDKHQHKEYPAASTTFGTLPPKYPKTETHNGLRKFVVDYLRFEGHHAEVVSNIGRPIQKFIPKFNIFTGKEEQLKGGIEWQKGSGKNGTSDIHSHIIIPSQKFPVPVYIEIKVGKDWQRPDQQDFEHQVTLTGALYWLIRSPEQFFDKYDKLLLS